MITYIKLENFLSFGNILFDFRKTQTEVKRFVAIYGENGSGKSNLVCGFRFIEQNMKAFSQVQMLAKFRDSMLNAPFSEGQETARDITMRTLANAWGLIDIDEFYNSHRMIGTDAPTSVEIGFEIDGKPGVYSISFCDTILHESLIFTIKAAKGTFFEFDKPSGTMKISGSMFNDNVYKKEVMHKAEQYWGKYSFMSLLYAETYDKNADYIEKALNGNLLRVIRFLEDMVVRVRLNSMNDSVYLSDYDATVFIPFTGKMEAKDADSLIEAQDILNDYYRQACPDIVSVFFETKPVEDDKLEYSLNFKKRIAGEIRVIPFEQESSGIKSMLQVFNGILDAIRGKIVIFDELDENIHDMLMPQIIENVPAAIKGQLIVTTHNTLMLEKIDKHSAYVIDIDANGDKRAVCVSDVRRVQGENNIRSLYLKGFFGGSPTYGPLDYDYIAQIANDDGEE